MKLNFDELFASYPEPMTLYTARNQERDKCFCVLGIVCDYARKTLGIAVGGDNTHFPSPIYGGAVLKALNKALSAEQALQATQCITRQNDSRRFDAAKATLKLALDYKKGQVLQLEAAPVFNAPVMPQILEAEQAAKVKKPRAKKTKPLPPPESGDVNIEDLTKLLDMTF